MKTISKRLKRAFTLLEMMVVIAVVMLLASMLLPAISKSKAKATRIGCINNLKEIGIAGRLWSEDNGNLVPAQQMVVSNGWKDFLTNGNAGPKCWMNYAALANDMGQSPKLVLCPDDERQAAGSFLTNFGNTNISYFVGVGANDRYPQSIAGGDRNLGPGTTPRADYGYSPADGLGNDVAIPTNGAVGWSLKMHSRGSVAGAGNIFLGDGSVQQVSSANFHRVWLSNAPPTTNWPVGYVPAMPSIRLVFP
jgi:prepilin-type N-terminal cleavage/methylation domain-containing protein